MVESIVMYGIWCILDFFFLIHPFEIAIENHSQRPMRIDIFTIPLEFMIWAREPFCTLVLKHLVFDKSLVKNKDDFQ